MSHRWLIAVSMTAHVCVAGGLFATGIWQLERLHADKLHVELRAPLAMPAPAGRVTGTPTPVPIPHPPPRPHPPVIVQPSNPPTPETTSTGEWADGGGGGSGDPNATGKCLENCGDQPAAPVCGNGSREDGEQCDDGNTLDGDGCSATCRIEAKPQPPAIATVAPNVLQGLRVSGDTQVRPNDGTQQQMVHDGTSRVIGVVKLCLAADGGVSSANVLRSTKYPDYDQRLLAAVQGWRYQPYSVGGVAIRACSTVTFIYQIQ
jgi:TonB family protein